ncbi:MerR family transcriptional regulator [Quadrisphaera sp. DSM 44207]|uniref:MerR family transcriptional regulator n=1 Tax=Quadrisphaera sp. DSM 44207 TaxID=1881057 RepID=UPI0008811F53|nr:MerR family transcriptional regulator [Quadrisphaera sp. DSM 44207]SDQ39786.1 DNA-binding transcriptional regulator, MerR family [Quadrisphaera sp. DSM 44207]
MRIGEVAAAAGVSPRALRYYEEQGLLASERSAGGQRRYPQDAVDRVRWIQALYGAGLSSRVLAGLLPCVHTGAATPQMLQRLAAERERIDAQVHDLAATRDRLDAVIAAAGGTGGGTAQPCPVEQGCPAPTAGAS